MESNSHQICSRLLECVLEAGDAVAEIKNRDRDQRFKEKDQLVTGADQLSHELLHNSLSKRFPELTLVMEEQENEAEIPPTCIVVDELDGILVYTHGGVDWGVTCALIDNGRPVSAVIYLPDRRTIVTANAGEGAWINNRRILFPKRYPINTAVLLAEINSRLEVSDQEYIQQLASFTAGVRSLACSTASVTDLLLGRSHIYVNLRGGKVWDFAAGALAIDEAGGTARQASGEPIDWGRREFGVLMLCDKNHLNHIPLART